MGELIWTVVYITNQDTNDVGLRGLRHDDKYKYWLRTDIIKRRTLQS